LRRIPSTNLLPATTAWSLRQDSFAGSPLQRNKGQREQHLKPTPPSPPRPSCTRHHSLVRHPFLAEGACSLHSPDQEASHSGHRVGRLSVHPGIEPSSNAGSLRLVNQAGWAPVDWAPVD
jgi:hypothetical protein